MILTKSPDADAYSSRFLEIVCREGAGQGLLNDLPRDDQRVIGRDIAKVQFGWPIGLPVCRPLGHGLWEVTVVVTEQAGGPGPVRIP